MKIKFKGIEEEEINIPEWHKNLVNERLKEYKANPGKATDFGSTLDEIEGEL